MKAPIQRLIIEAPDVYNYYAEHGNLKLYVDPLFRKGQAKIKSGIVRAVPDHLHDWCTSAMEIEVGDKVYFHYNALHEDNAIPDHDGLWMIDYTEVFCSVRNGEIIMMNGRVLVSPIYDDDVVDMEVQGEMRKVRVSRSGLIVDMKPKYSSRYGVLAYVGTPLRNEPTLSAKSGDRVVYVRNGDFLNTIEGKEYFVMYQEDILVVL